MEDEEESNGYSEGKERVDLTPDATSELAIEPQLDITADGKQALVQWRVLGEDRVDDHHVMVFDLNTRAHRLLPQGGSVSTENAPNTIAAKTRSTVGVLALMRLRTDPLMIAP